MKRTNKILLLLATLGVLVGALAMPAVAGRKPEMEKREKRVVELEYRSPAASTSRRPSGPGVCYWFTQTGCVGLDTEPTEKWVTIDITDAVSERVAAGIDQWSEQGARVSSRYICGSTERPVRLHPSATQITVWIYAAPTCVGSEEQAHATMGTIKFTLFSPPGASPPPSAITGTNGTRIPKRVQIADPRGDANFLPGDQMAPEMSGAADILRTWFTHDNKTISAHIQTATAPPGPKHLSYLLFANPDPGRSESGFQHLWTERSSDWARPENRECLVFRADVFPRGDPRGIDATLFQDYCDEHAFDPKPLKARMRTLPDGSGLISLTAPRRTTLPKSPNMEHYSERSGFASDDFAPGGRGIFDPYVVSRVHVDVDRLQATSVTVDQTKRGSSYRLPALGGSTKRPRCDRFSPTAPMNSSSRNPGRALKAPIRTVTDRATKNDPLVVRYRQLPANHFSFVTVGEPLAFGQPKFVNIQIVSRRRLVGLHVKLEWPAPSTDNLDVFVWNEDGKLETYSETVNPATEVASLVEPTQGYGGQGWEYLVGEPVRSCAGFTVENAAWRVSREMPVTAKIWLGRIGRRED